MNTTLERGASVASSFTVKGVHRGPAREIGSYSIAESLTCSLDARFENEAVLAFYTVAGDLPSDLDWASIVNGHLEPAKLGPMWQPFKIQRRCVCLAYKMRNPNGDLCAITQMLASENKTLVSAKLLWNGFPGINRFYVGFKPGMRQRTEDLLSAGLGMIGP